MHALSNDEMPLGKQPIILTWDEIFAQLYAMYVRRRLSNFADHCFFHVYRRDSLQTNTLNPPC